MRRVLANGMVIVALVGCGLTKVKGPAANRPPNERPVCTTSDADLKIDAAVGAVGVLSILTGAVLLKAASNPEVPQAMIIGGIVVTAAMLGSSGIGYSRVKACRAATAEYERTHPAGPYSPMNPQPYPPQPPPEVSPPQ